MGLQPVALWRGMAGLLMLSALLFTPVAAGEKLPAITIIIDDMGNHKGWGIGALEVPGPITYAFLPHTQYARTLAQKAHEAGKEVMLHLPMQSHQGNRLGPGGLTLHMTEKRFLHTLAEDIKAIPHVKGVNNHMGSLLTQHPGSMSWLMQGLRQYGELFFIDSRTSEGTVASLLADEYRVPNTRRDIFLDNNRDPAAILAQFRQLIRQAKRTGYAVGIGHPYPETALVLKKLLAETASLGVRLIPASEMIQTQGRNKLWQEPSSPSLKVVKNSKR
ncbi:MAG: divergent polysaccharide deacetylase family protein [Sedimenticola sp.]